MLAKNVNDNACIQYKRGAFEFFASKPQAGARSYNGRRRLPQDAGATAYSRPSKWLIAVFSFIGRTGLCIRVWPSSRICCLSSLL